MGMDLYLLSAFFLSCITDRICTGRLTWWVSYKKQDLRTIRKLLGSIPVLLVGFVLLIISIFCVAFCLHDFSLFCVLYVMFAGSLQCQFLDVFLYIEYLFLYKRLNKYCYIAFRFLILRRWVGIIPEGHRAHYIQLSFAQRNYSCLIFSFSVQCFMHNYFSVFFVTFINLRLLITLSVSSIFSWISDK